MSVFRNHAFISELLDRNEIITSNSFPFLQLTKEELNFKPSSDSWSIAEIYLHLNNSNAVFINSIFKKIRTAPDTNAANFKTSWLGDWFYERLIPRPDGSLRKLKSPKHFYEARKISDCHKVISDFIEHQNEIHDILVYSENKDLKKIKIPFYFNGILKFSLGDTLRFLLAHNERYLLQAQKLAEKFEVFQNG